MPSLNKPKFNNIIKHTAKPVVYVQNMQSHYKLQFEVNYVLSHIKHISRNPLNLLMKVLPDQSAEYIITSVRF